MALDAMDIDMDLDPEIARFQAEAAELSAQPDIRVEDNEEMNVEEGEVAADEVAGNKVHISGLDDLSQQDIMNFGGDHYSGRFKIQWVNDSCANLVYDSDSSAAEALKAFSAESTDDPLQERRAVTLATHPHVQLYVRMARNTDVKEAGAAERSRYYLFHPEHDPANRPRGPPNRRGGRRRGGFEGRRRSQEEESTFDVDLYDDDPEAKAASAKRKMSHQSEDDLFSGRSKVRRVSGRGADLIVDRREGRLRNRSASPLRDGDGRFGFNDDQPYRKTARHRTPPLRSHSTQANNAARETIRTELFPSRKTGTPLTNDHIDTRRPIELFPNQTSQTQDLFPDKVNHRRQDAKDLGPDEVATAIGKFDLIKQRQTPTYSQSGRRPDNARQRNRDGKPRDLFDRISGPSGRLTEQPPAEDQDGVKIRGAGNFQGFSIKGASQGAQPVELFPGKEIKGDLFPHKMKGRGAQRKMADDLF